MGERRGRCCLCSVLAGEACGHGVELCLMSIMGLSPLCSVIGEAVRGRCVCVFELVCVDGGQRGGEFILFI